MSLRKSYLILLLFPLSLFAADMGQDEGHISPREMPQRPGKIIEPEEEEKKEPDYDKDKVLVDHLTEIILIDNPDQIGRSVKDAREMHVGDYLVAVDDFSIPNEGMLVGSLSMYLGDPITIRLLDEIREAVVNHYHKEGYPIVGASVPAGQNIKTGKIYVLILVGKLMEVKARGGKWFSDDWVASQLSLEPGDEILAGPLMEDLAWLNNNPFRTVDLLYEKGETLSATNILLETTDRIPLRVYGGYENTGNIVAGDQRWLTGMNWGNVWGLDHQFNAQFMTARKTNRWWGLSGDYIIPIQRWRNTFKAFGSYIEISPLQDLIDPAITDSGSPLFSNVPLDVRGTNWRAGARYFIELPSVRSYNHRVLVGYDYKRTNNFLAFSLNRVFNTFFDISQFLVGYEGTYESKSGIVLIGTTIFISPGNMTSHNKDDDFKVERDGATANYVYARVTLDKITIFPYNFSHSISTLFQWSSGKLLPSEELSLGGFLSIRGYDENEVISDQGFIIKNELRCPPINFVKFDGGKVWDELQFLVFLDFGFGIDVDKSILNKEYELLASFGPGVRYNLREFLIFRFDYGIQLHDVKNRPFASNESSRMHLGLIVGF